VRELLNFVRRLVVFCPGPMITQAQVRLLDTPGGGPTPAISRLEIYKDAKHRLVDDFTRSYMQRLLEETGGNVSQAARLSGLERVSLQKILRRLGMAAEGFRGRED
jgi:Response regulator containing CheY-like receiver, AAA-type ATPase, and DNA-binding domains